MHYHYLLFYLDGEPVRSEDSEVHKGGANIAAAVAIPIVLVAILARKFYSLSKITYHLNKYLFFIYIIIIILI